MADAGAHQSGKSVGHKLSLGWNDMNELNSILTPGSVVRHPAQPDWGLGQVQSNIAGRITVNFQDAGKVVIDGHRVVLELVDLA